VTTNQLIALLFPVGAGLTMVAGGLIAKHIWVDRPRALEERLESALQTAAGRSPAADTVAVPADSTSFRSRQIKEEPTFPSEPDETAMQDALAQIDAPTRAASAALAASYVARFASREEGLKDLQRRLGRAPDQELADTIRRAEDLLHEAERQLRGTAGS